MSLLFPILKSQWLIDNTDLALLAAATNAGMIIGALGLGALSDTIGRRPIFQLSLALSSVCGFLSAVAPHFGLFVFLRFLLGIGYGCALRRSAPPAALSRSPAPLASPVGTSWSTSRCSPSSSPSRTVACSWHSSTPSSGSVRPWRRRVAGEGPAAELTPPPPLRAAAPGNMFIVLVAWIVVPTLGWRWLVGISAVPAFIMLFARAGIPEVGRTPRWLAPPAGVGGRAGGGHTSASAAAEPLTLEAPPPDAALPPHERSARQGPRRDGQRGHHERVERAPGGAPAANAPGPEPQQHGPVHQHWVHGRDQAPGQGALHRPLRSRVRAAGGLRVLSPAETAPGPPPAPLADLALQLLGRHPLPLDPNAPCRVARGFHRPRVSGAAAEPRHRRVPR